MAKPSKFTEDYNILKDGRRVWIIQADMGKKDTGWHWNEWIDNRPQLDDWGGDDFIRSPVSRKRIREEFRPGDIAFCYQATPDQQFVGFARIASRGRVDRDGLGFKMDWWKRANGPTWQAYRDDDLLAESDKAKLRVGTIFRLSASEAARLYSLYKLTAKEKTTVERELALPPEITGGERQPTPSQAMPPVLVRTKETKAPPTKTSGGGGFGCPEDNSKVEKAAILAVTKHFRSVGWDVVSVEADKCGYDLRVKKRGKEEFHIEVKGVSGAEPSFVITANELRTSSSNPSFRIAVVTRALSAEREITLMSGRELQEDYRMDALSYMARPR